LAATLLPQIPRLDCPEWFVYRFCWASGGNPKKKKEKKKDLAKSFRRSILSNRIGVNTAENGPFKLWERKTGFQVTSTPLPSAGERNTAIQNSPLQYVHDFKAIFSCNNAHPCLEVR
jgi:hypothetical protein